MISPKVSILIPSYNHDQYLRQRIETVLNQTYKNFEVIILDDCSTDNSRAIISSYSSHRSVSHIIFNEINSGNPFKQWQKGVSLTNGEWIWIAESDDYADETFLETLLKAGDHPNVGLIYCDSKIVSNEVVSSETFAIIKNKRFRTKRWSENYYNNGANEIENYVLPGGTINNTSAVLFNKKVFFDADPFDVSFRYIGDKYTFIKVLAKTDVVYIKESLNYYRDPFNSKHADKFIFYFYEQFLVFDWAKRNLKIVDKTKFLEGFYWNTRNSLFRDWDMTKFNLYRKLFVLNPVLLGKNILHNLFQAIRSIFVRMKRATST